MSTISEEEFEREVRTLKYVYQTKTEWLRRCTPPALPRLRDGIPVLTPVTGTCGVDLALHLAQASYLSTPTCPHQTPSKPATIISSSTRPTTMSP